MQSRENDVSKSSRKDVAGAYQRKLERERERNRERESKLEKEYRERERRLVEKWITKELRKIIDKHLDSLTRTLFKPNDKRHIPEDLRGLVAIFLHSLNRESVYETFTDPETGKQRRVKIGSEE